MIALKINNKFLDLAPTTNASFTLTNPIFSADRIGRTYSYPFNLQNTPHNTTTFKHIHRLDSSVVGRSFPDAVLYINHIPYEEGTIKILKVTNDLIKINFQNEAQNILEDLDEININTILDTVEVAQTIASYWVIKIQSGHEFYSMSINNAPLLVAKTFQGFTTELQVAEKLAELINDPFYIEFGIATTIGPDLLRIDNPGNNRMDIVLVAGFEVVEKKDIAIARHENMLAYADNIVQNDIPEFSLPVLNNDVFYETSNEPFIGFINYWRDGEQISNGHHTEIKWEHTYTPMVRLPYLLEKIIAQTNIKAIVGEFFEQQDIQQAIVYNNVALDAVFSFADIDGVVRYLNAYKTEINLNLHVPEQSASQFLTDYADLFNIYYEIIGSRLYIYAKVEQLRSEPIDWTNKTQPAYAVDRNENEGVTLDYNRDKNDKASIFGQLYPIIIGAGENKIKTNIAAVYKDTQTVILGENSFVWKLPIVKQKGSSDELGIGENDYSLRLFFDRGLQLDSEGKQYRLGTHDNKDYADNEVGELSLDWNGEAGLYERLHKETIHLINADEVSLSIRLTIADLLSIRKWRNSKRIIHLPQGQVCGIIKTVQFKATPTNLSFSKVVLKII